MRKFLLPIACLLFLVWGLPLISAQTPSLITSPKVVRIFYRERSHLDFLALKGFDLFEYTTDEYVEALVSPVQYQYLLNRGFKVEIREEKPSILAPFDPSCYHTYTSLVQKLQNLNSQYPNLTELFDAGDSWEKTKGGVNRDLWVMRITNEAITQAKPKILYVGEHHARELASVEIPLKFIDYLVTNYGSNAEVTNILDTREVWVMPMQNPDGHFRVENGENWRKNTDDDDGCNGGTPPDSYGVDTNRNYDTGWGRGGSSSDPCGATYRGPQAGSEPEVDAVKQWAQQENFNLLISYHSYGELVLHPWGCAALGGQTSHHAQFQALAQNLSELTKLNPSDTPYRYGQPQDILYSACGGVDDWFYQIFQKPAFTFEVGTDFWPSCSELDTIWQRNLKPMLYAASVANDPWNAPSPTPTGTVIPTPTAVPTPTPTMPPAPTIPPTTTPTSTPTPTPTVIATLTPTTITTPIPSATGGPTPTFCQQVDVNGDGKINDKDMQTLFVNWGGKTPDLNADAEINSIDAVMAVACWNP